MTELSKKTMRANEMARQPGGVNTKELALDVGILSGTPGDTISARTMSNEFFAADTTARTGGVSRMTKSTGLRIVPTGSDRSIGVKITAAAATQASTTTGKFRLIVEMQA